MRLLDEEKRLMGLVNPVDLVAVLLVVAAVVALAVVLFGQSPTAPPPAAEDTVEIVLLSNVPVMDEYQYEIGESVSRLGGSGTIGELVSVRMEPARRETWDAEGESVLTKSEVTYEVYFTVRGRGEITDVGASIGDERVRQNMVFDMLMPHFQSGVRVVSIKQAD